MPSLPARVHLWVWHFHVLGSSFWSHTEHILTVPQEQGLCLTVLLLPQLGNRPAAVRGTGSPSPSPFRGVRNLPAPPLSRGDPERSIWVALLVSVAAWMPCWCQGRNNLPEITRLPLRAIPTSSPELLFTVAPSQLSEAPAAGARLRQGKRVAWIQAL